MTPPRGQNRGRLVEAARSLTLAKGFPATTVDDMCAQAGVSKGSFYHHFASKEDIGNAALDEFFAEYLVAFTDGDYIKIQDPIERVHAFVQHARNVCAGPFLRNGCMMGTFALDLAESHPAVQAKLAAQFGGVELFVGQLIREAAEASGVTLPVAALSQQFVATIQGSIVLAKAHADPFVPVNGLGLFGDYLKLLLDQKGDR